MTCELCEKMGGDLIWQNSRLRVVLIADNDYPGFCRVIWSEHIKEMSDLSDGDRQYLMSVVFAVENAVRLHLQPEKINLASLGNVTPHLHWHVIPRWENDRHFPNPVWANPTRDSVLNKNIVSQLESLRETIKKNLDNLSGE